MILSAGRAGAIGCGGIETGGLFDSGTIGTSSTATSVDHVDQQRGKGGATALDGCDGGQGGGVPGGAGDIVKNLGEECDFHDFGGVTPGPGLSNSQGMACTATSTRSTGGVRIRRATASKREAGEMCDGKVLNGQSCKEFGFVSGDGLACKADCAGFLAPAARRRATAKLEPGETCDGAFLNGHTCAELGFSTRWASSAPGCALDSTGCHAICGDGTLEPGEQCDDGNVTNGDGCSSTCHIEGLTGGSTCGTAIPGRRRSAR